MLLIEELTPLPPELDSCTWHAQRFEYLGKARSVLAEGDETLFRAWLAAEKIQE